MLVRHSGGIGNQYKDIEADRMSKTSRRLKLIFIHGFRGSDGTFKDFPERVRTSLTNSLSNVDVEAVAYPQYKTQGDLSAAVLEFCRWLRKEVIDESDKNSPRERVLPIDLILMGHSMGGLLAADAVFHCLKEDHLPKHVHFAGLLAFDSPFYGLSHNVFIEAGLDRMNEITTRAANVISAFAAASSLQSRQTSSVSSSQSSKATGFSWGSLALGGAVAAAAAAAAGVGYINREQVGAGVSYLTGHLAFVGALTKTEEMKMRVQHLITIFGMNFHCFFIQLESFLPEQRTFIALPPKRTSYHFSPIPSFCRDEIDGHTSIFDSDNPHYYEFGLQVSRKILMILGHQTASSLTQ